MNICPIEIFNDIMKQTTRRINMDTQTNKGKKNEKSKLFLLKIYNTLMMMTIII
jgi:hypothetical protein